MIPYYNSHSHSNNKEYEIAVKNIFGHEIENYKLLNNQLYSVGIHPWHIDGNSNLLIEKIDTFIYNNPSVVAIGEIGIDRKTNINVKIQSEIFNQQLKIAKKYNIPVIIHCVKASSDILTSLNNKEIKFMIHGFNSNLYIANEFMNRNGILSVGVGILNKKKDLILNEITLDKLLIESDEWEDIRSIYVYMSKVLNISVLELKAVMQLNFNLFFKTRIL